MLVLNYVMNDSKCTLKSKSVLSFRFFFLVFTTILVGNLDEYGLPVDLPEERNMVDTDLLHGE